MTRNLETLRTFIDLVCAGQLEDAFTRLDPDVVVHEADGLPYRGSFRGPDGFAELLQKVAGCVNLRIEHTDLYDAGDTVVARMSTTLTAPTSGVRLDMPITEIYSFTPEGKIGYVDVFYKDTAAVRGLLAASREGAKA